MIQNAKRHTSAAIKKAAKVRSKRGNHNAANASGEMSADEVLSIDAFCKRMGTTRTAVCGWRHKGLKVRCTGNRRFIHGADWCEFIKNLPVVGEEIASVSSTQQSVE